jgi:hypothetical protein
MVIDPSDYDWEAATDLQVVMCARDGIPQAIAELERRADAA